MHSISSLSLTAAVAAAAAGEEEACLNLRIEHISMKAIWHLSSWLPDKCLMISILQAIIMVAFELGSLTSVKLLLNSVQELSQEHLPVLLTLESHHL